MDYRFTPEQEKFRDGDSRVPEAGAERGGRAGRGGGQRRGVGVRAGVPEEAGGEGLAGAALAEAVRRRDMGIMDQVIMKEELAYNRAPLTDFFGINMLGPVLMMYGTEEQKKEHLPGIASAEVTWSQGYSEPGSGSDLASLQTQGGARRRRLRDQRAEDLELERAPGGLDVPAGAHGPGRAEAQGHHVLPDADERAGVQHAAADQHGGHALLQRDVLRGPAHPGAEHRGRGEPRLVRRRGAARLRAQRHRQLGDWRGGASTT